MRTQQGATWKPQGATFGTVGQVEPQAEPLDAAARIAELEERIRLLEWDMNDTMNYIMAYCPRPTTPMKPDR